MFQPLIQQTQTSRCTALHRCTPLLNNIVLVRRTWLAAPVTGSDPDQVYNLAVVSRATDSSSNSTIVPAINTGHPGSVPALHCDGFRLKIERVSIWPCQRSDRLAFRFAFDWGYWFSWKTNYHLLVRRFCRSDIERGCSRPKTKQLFR